MTATQFTNTTKNVLSVPSLGIQGIAPGDTVTVTEDADVAALTKAAGFQAVAHPVPGADVPAAERISVEVGPAGTTTTTAAAATTTPTATGTAAPTA